MLQMSSLGLGSPPAAIAAILAAGGCIPGQAMPAAASMKQGVAKKAG